MSQYAELDRRILEAIKTRPGINFTGLYSSRDVRSESDRLSDLLNRQSYRIVDGRLQALKRSGQIKFKRAEKVGWYLANKEPKT